MFSHEERLKAIQLFLKKVQKNIRIPQCNEKVHNSAKVKIKSHCEQPEIALKLWLQHYNWR